MHALLPTKTRRTTGRSLSDLMLEGAERLPQAIGTTFELKTVMVGEMIDHIVRACAAGCVINALYDLPTNDDIYNADTTMIDETGQTALLVMLESDLRHIINSYDSAEEGRELLISPNHNMEFWCPRHGQRCSVEGSVHTCVVEMNDRHRLTVEHIAATLSRYGL